MYTHSLIFIVQVNSLSLSLLQKYIQSVLFLATGLRYKNGSDIIHLEFIVVYIPTHFILCCLATLYHLYNSKSLWVHIVLHVICQLYCNHTLFGTSIVQIVK